MDEEKLMTLRAKLNLLYKYGSKEANKLTEN